TKLLLMLNEMNHPIRGVIENMVLTSDSRIKKAVKEHNIAYLGSIPFDQYLEESLGQPTHLMKTPFMKNLQKLLPKLINASSD
ncbi:MAG: ATP-binding protein, partial [Candidatus Thermoplasmatota archaeon]|nr:ATP-binding protein [Candidatus Thermoplasmatota archaeon]MBU1940539.1 ATP-binding protein [Candidatus Thermoplasmatota archaeon]